jgi:hypothetical protein
MALGEKEASTQTGYYNLDRNDSSMDSSCLGCLSIVAVRNESQPLPIAAIKLVKGCGSRAF